MSQTQHKIAVVGTGYVGLTSGACLAHLGHLVTCVDVDETKIKSISSGVMPIYEEGLAELVAGGQSSGNLGFTTSLEEAVRDAEFVFLCLPTPPGADGMADISAIRLVVMQLRGLLRPGTIIVNKSTVPVNSTYMVQELINEPSVDVVSNPEFLREGSAVHDFLHPDRIVVGCTNPIAGERVGALYLGTRSPVLVTDPVSAESIKYMANAFLAMKISFVNQAAEYCDSVGADVIEVMKGLSFDPRIGQTFLNPGPGWGGSCFPKDTKALVVSATESGSPMTLIEEAINANLMHIDHITRLITRAAESSRASEPRICLLGLTFKANTDDTRESPALAIHQRLVEHFTNVVVYDPLAKVPESHIFNRVDSLVDAIRDADVVAILTEWSEFAELQPDLVASHMRGDTIIDGRYLLNKQDFAAAGLSVISIGR
jgi:UDPglucose 6-dehydrogenase